MLTSPDAQMKLRGRLLTNESLADYTSWHVGGKADIVYIPADTQDLAEFFQHLPLDIPMCWLGRGTHVLVRDAGIEGAVIVTQGLNRITSLGILNHSDCHIMRAESGVACEQAARSTARMGLAGLEFMIGLPGCIGSALAVNAGCYGIDTWQRIHSVETINRAGQIKMRSKAEYEIGYRTVNCFESEWFMAGHFELEVGDKNQLLSNINTLLEKRAASQPLSLGKSIFHNPPGDFASRLIELSGIKKMAIGGAYISEKNPNFIINDGTASASDIELLINYIQNTVEQKQGVRLVPEICIIGNK